MNATQLVDATLARAEAALESRTVADLAMAEASLVGCLDWSAKQEGCVQLVTDVLRTVSQELRAARS